MDLSIPVATFPFDDVVQKMFCFFIFSFDLLRRSNIDRLVGLNVFLFCFTERVYLAGSINKRSTWPSVADYKEIHDRFTEPQQQPSVFFLTFWWNPTDENKMWSYPFSYIFIVQSFFLPRRVIKLLHRKKKHTKKGNFFFYQKTATLAKKEKWPPPASFFFQGLTDTNKLRQKFDLDCLAVVVVDTSLNPFLWYHKSTELQRELFRLYASCTLNNRLKTRRGGKVKCQVGHELWTCFNSDTVSLANAVYTVARLSSIGLMVSNHAWLATRGFQSTLLKTSLLVFVLILFGARNNFIKFLVAASVADTERVHRSIDLFCPADTDAED